MHKLITSKKEQEYFELLIGIIILIVLVLTHGKYLYGSVTDWVTQHYRIPEYFRDLFYDTHNLFPNFSFHLGAGQNIYYLSYYGLFSPIVLFSYFLPFVSMQNYMIISTILSLLISTILFYVWVNKRYNKRISFILTVLFAFATPLLFHSHRHIMFMNYMPFLLMALMGVNRYFEKKKCGLLVISIFLMILTSYFFSVMGILVIGIYAMVRYIEITPNRSRTSYIKEGSKFIFLLMIPVLMAGILLLPTFYTILEGRVDGNSADFISLMLPSFKLTDTLYGGYSIGLTSILILAIIYNILEGKIQFRLLGIIFIILLCFPISLYVLNAGMYISGKVLIPFIPLALILIGELFKRSNIQNKIFYLYVIVSGIILWTNRNSDIVYLFIIDVLFTSVAFFLQKKNILILPITVVVISFLFSFYYSSGDILSEKNTITYHPELQYIYSDKTFYRINNLYNNLHSINQIFDTSFYTTSIYSSTSNANYKDFYNHAINNEFIYRSREILSTTRNLLSNIYLGNKYIIDDELNLIGYDKVFTDSLKVYKSDSVFSIGYATQNIMSKREYDSLKYPYNIDALLHYTIVGQKFNDVYKPKVDEISLKTSIVQNEVNITKKDNGYDIVSSKNGSKLLLTIDNKDELKNKILLIQFQVKNKSNQDRLITINDVENKVTKNGWKYHNENYSFEYTIAENNLSSLEILFSKGQFEIQNIKCYILDSEDILSIEKNSHEAFIIDRKKTKGDIIEGKIAVEEDGYFSISIPYDKGFSIYVDDEEIDYERVNHNFIGFPIKRGTHTIQLKYTAPWRNIGIYISIVGIILYMGVIILQKKYSKIM